MSERRVLKIGDTFLTRKKAVFTPRPLILGLVAAIVELEEVTIQTEEEREMYQRQFDTWERVTV